MDFKQLEAFTYTVQYKSFSEAAKKLYLSQPTISAHIMSLEKELNAKLINRTTKDFSVTQTGQRLYEYALNMLELRQKATEELSDAETKNLHIGASSVPAAYVLPKVLVPFHSSHPNLTYHIYCSDSIDILKRIQEGTLDIGFVGTDHTDTNCTLKPITLDELVITTPNTPYYEFLYNHAYSFETLLSSPIILRENTSGTKLETEQFLKEHNITQKDLNVIAYMNNPEAIKSSIIHGLGISILSRSMVEEEAHQGKLLLFSLGEQSFLRQIFIAYSNNRYLPKQVKEFLQFMDTKGFQYLGGGEQPSVIHT